MERIRAMVGKYGKVYLGAVILAVICDLIGTVSINIGIGTLTMFPMVFAVILGGCLGPDALRLFNKKEAKNRWRTGSCGACALHGKNGGLCRG